MSYSIISQIVAPCLFVTTMTHPLRTYVRDLFAKTFTESEAYSANIEKSIFNWAIGRCKKNDQVPAWDNKFFKHVYKQKAISINFNLKNSKNVLKDRIMAGEVSTRTIANLRPEELILDGPYAQTIKAQEVKALKVDLAQGRMDETKVGIFTCGKCKSMKTTYYEMQTRSADEPMTAFITCLDCGKRWKS